MRLNSADLFRTNVLESFVPTQHMWRLQPCPSPHDHTCHMSTSAATYRLGQLRTHGLGSSRDQKDSQSDALPPAGFTKHRSPQFAFCLAALPRCHTDPLNSIYHKVRMLMQSFDTRVLGFSDTTKPREHAEIEASWWLGNCSRADSLAALYETRSITAVTSSLCQALIGQISRLSRA